MQKAIPYRNWLPSAEESADPPPETAKSVSKVVEENAVVVFSAKGCCMCHVVKLLLHGHGVNPTILNVDERNKGELAKELVDGGDASAIEFPAVFLGGKLFGGLEDIMAAHISGELVPKLREAGALWL